MNDRQIVANPVTETLPLILPSSRWDRSEVLSQSPRNKAPQRPPVTAIVTTLNEEDEIAACIESLLWCDEIMVVDSFSSDQTIEIANRYKKVRVLERPYYGAASQKNWAIDRARHDWILILDADERVTPELRHEIEQLLTAGPGTDAYQIKRRTYFLGREIRFSGWQHDRVVRFFRRGSARYPNRRVHADMQTRKPAKVLHSSLVHFMVDSFGEYVRRLEKYAYWGAAQLWKEQRRARPFEVLVRPLWRFLRTYLVQAGVRDGMVGLVFCIVQAYGTFLKWATLWSWQTDLARGRSPVLPAFDEDETTWAWPNGKAEEQTWTTAAEPDGWVKAAID
jgi:glycosyltransferase involved in cell wall biosynthesis